MFSPRLAFRSVLFFAVLCTSLFSPFVRADVPVAVLGLDPIDTPEANARVVTEALRQRAAQSNGVKLVPPKDLVEVKLVFGCMEERPACLAQAGRSLGADRLIYGSVRKPSMGGGYTIVLKQLNVRTGQVEKFISEAVPSRALYSESTELSALAQKWLSLLLLSGLTGGLQITSQPEGATVTLDGVPMGQSPLALREVAAGSHVAQVELPGHERVIKTFEVRGGLVHDIHIVLARRNRQAAQPAQGPRPAVGPSLTQGPGLAGGSPDHEERHGAGAAGLAGSPLAAGAAVPGPKPPDKGRPLRILSYFLVGAAAITGGVAIYTWRTYTGEEEPARQALDVLQMKVPASPEVNAFFNSSERLSSCEPPAELTVRAMSDPVTVTAYNNYLEHCRRGRSNSQATTGLVATMGSLALLGVTSYIFGEALRHESKGKEAKAGGAKASWLYTPRLREISPAVSAQGGGVNLHFEF